jgi:transcriptional regulator with XRE-family HTH domain
MPHAPLKEVVRARIRALRLERGLTQEALCERAEVSVDTVNRVENGTRVPTIDALEKIAIALGASVAELLNKSATRPSKPAQPLRRLMALVELESAEVQMGVEEVVRAALKRAESQRPKRR